MPFYHALGSIPRKRHIVFRRPDGGLYAEELMGHEGFVGTSSLLYHVHPPTTVLTARKVRDIVWEADDTMSLRHRHFLTSRVTPGGSPTLDRMPLHKIGLAIPAAHFEEVLLAVVAFVDPQGLNQGFNIIADDLIAQDQFGVIVAQDCPAF